MPFRTLSRISRERSGAEQNPSVRNLVSPYRMCPASFSFSGLDGAEITLFPWHLQEYSPVFIRAPSISKTRSLAESTLQLLTKCVVPGSGAPLLWSVLSPGVLRVSVLCALLGPLWLIAVWLILLPSTLLLCWERGRYSAAKTWGRDFRRYQSI